MCKYNFGEGAVHTVPHNISYGLVNKSQNEVEYSFKQNVSLYKIKQ